MVVRIRGVEHWQQEERHPHALRRASYKAFVVSLVTVIIAGLLFVVGQHHALTLEELWSRLLRDVRFIFLSVAILANVIALFTGIIAWVDYKLECPWIFFNGLLTAFLGWFAITRFFIPFVISATS